MRRPERSEEFDSLLWGRWIHGGLDVKAEERYKRGQVVSEFRRAVVWIIDIVVIMIPVAIFFASDRARFTNVIYDVIYVVCKALYIPIVFSLITRITRGRTLGKALVNVKLAIRIIEHLSHSSKTIISAAIKDMVCPRFIKLQIGN